MNLSTLHSPICFHGLHEDFIETPMESMVTLWARNDHVFSLLTKIPHVVYVESMKHMDSMKTSPVDMWITTENLWTLHGLVTLIK